MSRTLEEIKYSINEILNQHVPLGVRTVVNVTEVPPGTLKVDVQVESSAPRKTNAEKLAERIPWGAPIGSAMRTMLEVIGSAMDDQQRQIDALANPPQYVHDEEVTTAQADEAHRRYRQNMRLLMTEPPANVKTYDPKDCKVTFGGIEITGMATDETWAVRTSPEPRTKTCDCGGHKARTTCADWCSTK